MRKTILVMCVLLSLVISTVSVSAETDLSTAVTPDIELQYENFATANVTFSITNGTANCVMSTRLFPGKEIDYGQITAYIKNSSGKIVKTFSKKVYPQLNQWIWSDSYKLTSKGTYHLQATVKFYKNRKLVETITKTSYEKAY